MTVSRVLNNKNGISDETRRHVLKIMRELGYRPNRVARSLATARTLKIGVLVPSISSAYFASVLEGVEHVFWENGYHMLLCNTAASAEREQSILNFFEEDRVDGVMVFSSHLPAQTLNTFLRNQQAAVMINSEVESGLAGHVRTDETNGMTKAIEHLVKAGRRHIGYIGFDAPSYAGRQRKQAFLDICQRLDLPLKPGQMVSCDRRSGYTAATQLLQGAPHIDAMLCFNDEIAAGGLRACMEFGRRVPEDVAVIGYDDIFLAELMTPPLTTLRLKTDKQAVGEMAAQMLLARIEGGDTCDELVLEHELIVRASAP